MEDMNNPELRLTTAIPQTLTSYVQKPSVMCVWVLSQYCRKTVSVLRLDSLIVLEDLED